jgi:glycosyltransferase involved in cell wall biosynthesis
MPANSETSSQSYPEWLAQRMRERQAQATGSVPQGLISILTCVYSGSDAKLFAATARSVLTQGTDAFEWVVLAQGAIDPMLDLELARVASDRRVNVIRRSENLGIIRGLRGCLEAATGEYVLPLDGDDLLTSDAVQVLAQALRGHDWPAFLFGDEDFWDDGRPRTPYLRPGWDPLLNLSSSYIWHPCVFRRKTALKLGAYSDTSAEFCQDWDTVHRFVRAGHEPRHTPEVLYHWRSHAGSSTNRPEPTRQSLASQREVLERLLRDFEKGELFEIAEFPFFRGLPEWWIKRRRVLPEPIDVILLSADGPLEEGNLAGLMRQAGYPFRTVTVVGKSAPQVEGAPPSGPPCLETSHERAASYPEVKYVPRSGMPGLRRATERLGEGTSAVFSVGLAPHGRQWPWEAIGIRALVPGLAFIAGRLVDGRGNVCGGPQMYAGGSATECPYLGWSMNDAGPFATALKPHCVDALDSGFFLADNIQLRDCLASLPDSVSVASLGEQLGLWARMHGLRVGYSPIITAVFETSVEHAAQRGDV